MPVPTTRRRRTTAVAAVALVALSAACGGPAGTAEETRADVEFLNTTPAASGQLDEATWLMSTEPSTLDLDGDAATSHSDLVMANVCERLLQVQPDLSVAPHLAESYEWATPTTLVFRLREDVTFHSGAAMTARDVVWSLNRHADGAAESDEYVNVESIEETGPYEVTVHLTQSDAVFLQSLAGDAGVVLERAAVEAQGDAYGTPSGEDACSGPLALDSWRSGQEIELARAGDYWNPERASRTDRITFRWMSDDAMVNSLVTGSATGTYLENLAAADRLAQSSGLTVNQGPSTRVWSLMVTERGGLADPRLRTALSLALDREGINRAGLAGLGQPWREPVGSGAWGYETAVFEAAHEEIEGFPASPGEEDIEEARRLVAEVGDTEPIVVASDGTSIRNVVANAVVSAADEIGLEASIERVSEAEYTAYYSNEEGRRAVDLFADDYFISKFDPLGFYKNGASDSTVQWLLRDPGFDDLVARGRAALDDAERARLSVEMATAWADAKPWISLVSSPSTVVMSDEVTGVPAAGIYFYYPWAADLGTGEG
ncbi:ABC transporter substrate-binding protein [Streptomyces sp. SBT349]|uniref:ABC transporter substrate-binding protein n=1 Tax=Streptomyces sp. SBT349 TaxID=1580539 RepID=UPI00066D9A9D|nr:ABC transporter substrate-binding protein [Streptomyces sp. SBT349]